MYRLTCVVASGLQGQGDTLDYLGIPGLHIAGAQGILVIAVCQVLLMVSDEQTDES